MVALRFIITPFLASRPLFAFTSLPQPPVWRASAHRTLLRPLFCSSVRAAASMEGPSQVEKECFKFGTHTINGNLVFFTTEYSYAFVNLRPVVPGHILVSPKRVVPRFIELTDEEATDIWLTANCIGAKLESHFNATSLTFTMQDGPQAGQTVPHVHIHILPRKVGDFKRMDEVYDVMDQKERELAEALDLDRERKDRTIEEMVSEASELRGLLQVDL